MKLRDYQKTIIDQAITHLRTTDDPGVINACVGAGKTLMISHIARHVLSKGGRVVSLAHTKELVEGAADTFRRYVADIDCGIYSAALGRKDNEHDVTFATERSLLNGMTQFEPIDLLVIDEAHRVNDFDTETCYLRIIEHFRALNPKLRILGLTGTPFRLGHGSIVGVKRLFKSIIAEITVPELIEQGYLKPPIAPTRTAAGYDFSRVRMQAGHFRESDLDEATADERLTRRIIADVIEQTTDRNRVLLFASTVRHAYEIAGYLPKGTAAVIEGGMAQKDRERVLKGFADGSIKFVVNRDILTTGYDEPGIDAMALLRPTESRALLIQMLGRGLRLHDSKVDALVLDYAANLGNHGGLDDLFNYNPKARQKDSMPVDQVECPDCGKWSSEFARRCECGYFFVSRDCHKCGTKNDVTRRYCSECDAELIDPNDKLTLRANEAETDQEAHVVSMEISPYRKNKETLRITYQTEELGCVNQYLLPGSNYLKYFLSKALQTKSDSVLKSANMLRPAPFKGY